MIVVNEGYNTHATIRGTLNMGTSLPTDAILTDWINLIDGTIEEVAPSPITSAAQRIEMNRLGVIWWDIKHGEAKIEKMPVIGEITEEEELKLTGTAARSMYIKV